MYATKLRLQNFKRFADSKIDLSSKITLLLGPNSSGKSSVIKSLLAIKQTASPVNEHEVFSAQGEYVDLGIYRDYVFEHRTDNRISFGIELSEHVLLSASSKTAYIEFVFGRDIVTEQARLLEIQVSAGDSILLTLTKKKTRDTYHLTVSPEYARALLSETLKSAADEKEFFFDTWTKGISARVLDRFRISPEKIDSNQKATRHYFEFFPIQLISSAVSNVLRGFDRDFFYIGPLRKSPSRSYSRTGHLLSVGASGEHTPSVLANLKSRASRERSKERDQNKRLEQLTSWIDRIFPGRAIEAKSLEELVKLEIEREAGSREVISDVGFGFSQVLPILVQAAVMPEDTTLLIEQPELHLHPQAQTKLAEIFAEASVSGRRFLIETHSEHLVRGLQLAVSNGTSGKGATKQRLKPTDLRFLYVPKAPALPREMELDIWGEFTEPWPSGFFDEAYQIALKLIQNKMSTQEKLQASNSRRGEASQR